MADRDRGLGGSLAGCLRQFGLVRLQPRLGRQRLGPVALVECDPAVQRRFALQRQHREPVFEPGRRDRQFVERHQLVAFPRRQPLTVRGRAD